MRRLGQQIIKLRDRLGITQEQLAESARLSQSRLNDIEQGLENPSLDVLMRLTVSLKAEPWEMLSLPYAGGQGQDRQIDGLPEYH